MCKQQLKCSLYLIRMELLEPQQQRFNFQSPITFSLALSTHNLRPGSSIISVYSQMIHPTVPLIILVSSIAKGAEQWWKFYLSLFTKS